MALFLQTPQKQDSSSLYKKLLTLDEVDESIENMTECLTNLKKGDLLKYLPNTL